MRLLMRLGVLVAFAVAPAAAGTYVQQSTFALPPAAIGSMDSDSVGSLYVLGRPSGAATYTVNSYATQAITPIFAFDTGVSSPAAFSVEGSGIVDIIDGAPSPIVLKRFQNSGFFLAQSTYSIYYPLASAAIDKTNQRVYLAFQYWVNHYCVQCLGCPCAPSGTEGFINVYDFSGKLLKVITMPGISATAGSCYTPSAMTVDPQGNLYVADGLCQSLLKYSPTWSLLSNTSASAWTPNFSPRGMWTDASSSLYISEPVCGAGGCPPGVVKLGADGTLQTSFTSDSPNGCAWDNRILYLSSSGGEPMRRLVFNGTPSVAPQSAPLGMVVQHSSAASLNWQASTDPDGDPVSYSLLFGASSTQLSSIGSTAQSNFTTQPLSFGATYYWQVVTQDSYLGIPLQTTPSPVVGFNLNLVNSPPNAFGGLSGIGTAVTRDTFVTLSWQATGDPDGDPVVYDVLWRPSSQPSQTLLGTTSQNSWQVTGLAFGTTYYWSVRARDVYNASRLMNAGAEQPYYPAFKNSPPPAPSILSGSGTSAQHTATPQATLAWSGVLDPDGDAVAYRLFVGTAPAALSLVQNGSGTSYSLPAPQFGTTYYWQVAAYDPYGGASTTSLQSLLLVLQNNPPSPVVYVTTATSFYQHTLTPAIALSWAASTDPDGDPVSYRLDVQTSTGSWPSVSMGGATNLTLATQLETTYYWRVAATDPFGGASTGTWMSFVPHLANRPPSPIVYSAPSTLVTRATSYPLSWQDTGDPDGDPYSYSLYLSTKPTAQYLVQTGSSTAFTLNFQFGTTYYWSVSATDSFGATTTGPVQTFLPVFQNTPPPAPSIFSGSGSLGEHTLTPSATLRWSSVFDPNGDPVAYRLLLGSSPAALAVAQDGQNTSYALPAPLFGTTYYWDAAAYDPYGGASTTPVQSLYLYLQNSPPSPFSVLAGTGTVYTRSTTQLLSWQVAIDPDGDPVTYDLAVSTNPGAQALVQSSTATSYSLAIQLGTTYYWQVIARDGFGGATPSGLQTLLPLFRNSAPTVPVNQSKTGTILYHGFAPSQSFFWQASTDPDGDPFTYSLSYGTDASHLTVISPAVLGATLSVPLNAAFYYSITATDVYGTVSPSPVSWVYYQFVNAPPGPFDVSGTTGTVVTRQTSATLSWTPSFDPDGDQVSYGVFVGTAPSALSPLATTTRTSALLSNMAFGTTYFWRVDAYDGYGGTTTVTEGVQSLVYQFYDPQPSPVIYLSTASTYSEHTFSPSAVLSWAPSYNAAGDPITYRLDIQTSSGSWPSVSMGQGTNFTLATLFETTYTWRVAALDPYGGASTGVWNSFIVHLANRPPYPISYTAPATITTRATAFPLTWQDTGDPDGDAVSYALYLSTVAGAQFLVQQGTSTSYNLSYQFGTTYYWRIAATDVFGAQTAGAVQAFLPVFQDTPPPAPSILSGSGSLGEHTLAPSAALSWSNVFDADGDPVSYRLAIGTNAAALSVAQDGQSRNYNLPGPLFGTTYYWQVTAYDPYAATSALLQSLYLYLKNASPLPFAVVSGTGTVYTRSNTQLLSWQNAVDPDGDALTYDLAVATTPGGLALAQSSATTTCALSIQIGTTYYWQVTARDGFGGATSSGLQTLLPLFRNSAPTVPVNQSKTGTIFYHGFAPSQSFFWQASFDPDGDPFTYSLSYGTDAGHMAAMSPAVLGATLSVPLNTAFYYSVVATDIYGAASPSAVNWVFYQFANNPPGAFDILGTTGTVITRQTSAALSWTGSIDPDGDPVSYGVFAGTSPASLALLANTTKTSAVLPNMAFGATYYWRVDAYDGFGGTTTASEGVQSVVNQFYDPPTSPVVYFSSSPSYSQHTFSPNVVLSWAPSYNAAGDPISYRVDIQTSSGAWSPVAMGGATSLSLATLFETTYTWRVAALDPYGGASTGAWTSFAVHLANRPPYPIAYSSPASVTTRSTSFPLSWQSTGDPDGDPVAYSISVSTDPRSQSIVQQGTATVYALNFQFGATYYWSVTATDSFAAATTGSLQAFLPVFQDAPPPAPSILGGAGAIGEHTLAPSTSLRWAGVLDADGDPVAYRLSVGTSPSALSLAQDGSGLAYNLPSPLIGTTYYWQVTAYDPYAATAAPIQSLYLYLQNSPPLPFGVVAGSGTISNRSATQLLSWQNAIDPDGDAVTYDLAVATAPGAWAILQSSTATSFTLATQFGATYYWQVTARDGFGGATSSGVQTLLPTFLNRPPTVPVNQSKTGTIPYHGFSPAEAFFWQPSTDLDGDPFTYSLQIGTDPAQLSSVSPLSLGYAATSLATNLAYYFRIVATDIYGAASPSPVNWVYYQFTNSPPQPFDVLTGTGTVVTRATAAALAWNLSSDPDGDLVTYRVYGGTSAAALSVIGDTTQPAFTLRNLSFGATYYWRVDAYDGFGGTTTANGGVQSLLCLFKNSAPSVPVYLTTTTVFGIHATSPTISLAWAPSADADGDPVSYFLDVQTSSGAWPTLALGTATSITLSPQLDAAYSWRVTAADPYAASIGPWQSFVVHFANRPPSVPGVLTGNGISSQHTLAPSALLSWSPASDPDGDAVTYALSVSTWPAGMAQVLSGTSTSYALPAPQFGTTYYWQVSVLDPYGAASLTPVQTELLALQNNPPSPFAVISGSGTLSTRASTQTLSWQTAIDPDGDPVVYGFFLSTSAATLAPVQLSTATSFLLSFQYGTTYYWRADAYDGFGGTTTATGGVQTFLPLFLNDPPPALNLTAPFKGSPVITTMRDSVSVSWQQVTTPQGDPVDYTVYLGDSPSSLDILTRISQTQTASGLRLAAVPGLVRPQSTVQQVGDSVTLTLTQLDYYKTYFFRVQAANTYGASSQTPLQTFSLSAANGFPKAYNYPNPFNPNRGGTHIVFNAPPSGYARATVYIYSELQDLLFQRDFPNIPPGISEFAFDGRDRFGRALYSGSYICRVRFEGPADKEVFYLLVVK